MVSLPLSRSGREVLEVASRAAEEAGSLLLKHMYGQLKLGHKEGRANLVTDVDLMAEKTVIGVLQSEYPDFNILSEESSAVARNSQFTWVIDPLDGTNNYVHGVPFICVSIGLALGQEAVLGVIYDPVRKEIFTAQKGRGASLNGLPISVAQRTAIGEAFLGADLGYDADKGKAMLDFVQATWPDTGGLRLMGSAALGLTYVACGRLDAYIHPCLSPWDVAAAIALVEESGGKITDWQGNPATIESKAIVAANEVLHREFLRLIRDQSQLRLKGV
jgi:myo-inositol-1(or 4)-monophosphatase